MLVSEFLTKVNYSLRGIDDDTPDFGGDEASYWLDTLNRKINELYQDSKNWGHIYEVNSLGVVTASASPSYNLPSDFLYIEEVYIIDTDSKRHNLTLIKPEERNEYNRCVFVAGLNPQKLYFTGEIEATEDIVGGTLYVTGYFMPAELDADDDVLPLPDPNWGVAAVAAEIAFGDITYEDKAESLNAKANYLYGLMTKKNRKGTYKNPRVTPYNVKRIGVIER